MWIKGKFSIEHHVVCNGKTNRPSEKGLLQYLLSQSKTFVIIQLLNTILTLVYLQPSIDSS